MWTLSSTLGILQIVPTEHVGDAAQVTGRLTINVSWTVANSSG